MTEVGNGWDDMPTDAEIIDLGNGAKYTRVVDKNGTWIAINEWHLTPTGRLCGGFVPFDVQSEWLAGGRPKWTVQSYDPLTLSPSLQCTSCGHHGHIQNGRWVPA